MKNINKILVLFLIASLLSGCGLFRKVFKSKEYSKSETSSKITKDSTGVRSDKSVTTTTEIIDTTVATPKKIVNQDVHLNMDSLINGLTAVKNDLLDVKLVFNPVTGILSTTATIKPQRILVQLNKKTVKENDILEKTNQHTTIDQKSKDIKENYVLEKDPTATLYWIGGIVLLLSVIGSILFWVKRNAN